MIILFFIIVNTDLHKKNEKTKAVNGWMSWASLAAYAQSVKDWGEGQDLSQVGDGELKKANFI